MVILWWPLVRPMSILFRQLHISYVYLSHTRILIIILKSNNFMTIIIWVMLFLKVVGEYGLAYKHQFRKQILLLHIKKTALFKMTKLILSYSLFPLSFNQVRECEKNSWTAKLSLTKTDQRLHQRIWPFLWIFHPYQNQAKFLWMIEKRPFINPLSVLTCRLSFCLVKLMYGLFESEVKWSECWF